MKHDKEIVVSVSTKEKAISAKLYIERRYTKLIQSEMQKKLNWDQLYQKMNLLSIPEVEQEQIKSKILHKEAENLRQIRQKDSLNDFQFVKVIGKGAFGEVRLYKCKRSNQPVAIKRMVKSEMIFKNKILQAQVQQSIMAKLSLLSLNKHVVKLLSSFQDQSYLYLVMQYLGGGDMMNLLIKKDIFEEEEARFYVAELVLAIECVHKMKYIHRDLKPDNILIDTEGHLKLSDFGLCKHTETKTTTKLTDILTEEKHKPKGLVNSSHRRKLAYSTVGTPDYVAPQVQSKNGYTETVDWWSLGVILYEMLVGYPPFCAQTSQQTWLNIQNWRKCLKVPNDRNLSATAIDLIKKLITDEKYRLGSKGVEEIKAHPFFNGVNWKTIKESEAPNIPELEGGYDTRHFDEFESGEIWIQEKETQSRRGNHFIGYTFKQNPKENSELLKALVDLDTLMPTNPKTAKQLSLTCVKDLSSSKEKPLLKKMLNKVPLAASKGLGPMNQNINNVKITKGVPVVSKGKGDGSQKKPVLRALQPATKIQNLRKK